MKLTLPVLIVVAVALVSLLLPSISKAQGSGTINQLTQWFTSGAQVRLASTTAALRIPSLTNCDTIDTDSNGVFLCGTDSGGGAGSGTVATGTPLVANRGVYATGVDTIGTDSSWTFNPTTDLHTFLYASSTVTSADTLCLTGDTCITTWPTGGSSFSYPFPSNATSTTLTFNAGLLSVGSTTINGNATTTGMHAFGSVRIPTLTSELLKVDANGLALEAIAGTDYEVPVTAGDGLTRTANDFDCDTASGTVFGCLSSADWTTFNNKQATITAGDALTLTGTDIDFDGGATPAGDLGGTWASPSVTDDSHAHTGTTLSGIDISDDTNLTAGDALTLTGDDIDFDGGTAPGGSLGGTWASPTIDDLFLLNTGDTGAGHYILTSSFATNASTTNATTTSLYVTGLTSALSLFDANGQATEYAGTSCTNQFVRSLSALGAATCATVANTDLANSTVSYGGVTLSLGGTDATPGFNLADATGLPIDAGTTGTLPWARGGTATSTNGLEGQALILDAGGDNLTATSSIFVDTASEVGIGIASPAGRLHVENSTHTANTLLVNNGTTGAPPTIPNSYVPTVTVNVSNTTGSRPFFFGYTNAGAWQAYVNMGACGAFTTMCFNMGNGANDYTALKANSTELQIAGDGTNSSNDGDFTNVIFGNTGTTVLNSPGNVGISTTSPYAKLSVVGEVVARNFTATSSSNTSRFEGIVQVITRFIGVVSAAFTPTTEGETGIDTTSNQFKYYSNSAVRVLGNGSFYPAFTYATSTAWTGTTTIPLGTAYVGETWNGVQCFTDTGTLQVSFNDGTNRMNWMNASATVGTVTLSTNNTFTPAEKPYVDVGTPASSPTKISCTVNKSLTAD